MAQDPVFIISLEKGLADRHQMPIGQVIGVLNEVRQMITETGKDIYKERGGDPAGVDFGLELVADSAGNAFTKGSLRAQIAITSHVEVGILAASRIIDTIFTLSTSDRAPSRVEHRIIDRLDKITYLHEKSKTHARFTVAIPKSLQKEFEPIRHAATFGSDAVRRLDSLREPIFTEYGITVYGKLFQLKDKSVQEDSNGKFWGELQRDNGERWRVQFERRKLKEITSLFTKQVMVTGDVSYFQTRTPKLAANSVEADEERDMVFAFDELFGIHKLSYDADLQTLLGRRYGED